MYGNYTNRCSFFLFKILLKFSCFFSAFLSSFKAVGVACRYSSMSMNNLISMILFNTILNIHGKSVDYKQYKSTTIQRIVYENDLLCIIDSDGDARIFLSAGVLANFPLKSTLTRILFLYGLNA